MPPSTERPTDCRSTRQRATVGRAGRRPLHHGPGGVHDPRLVLVHLGCAPGTIRRGEEKAAFPALSCTARLLAATVIVVNERPSRAPWPKSGSAGILWHCGRPTKAVGFVLVVATAIARPCRLPPRRRRSRAVE